MVSLESEMKIPPQEVTIYDSNRYEFKAGFSIQKAISCFYKHRITLFDFILFHISSSSHVLISKTYFCPLQILKPHAFQPSVIDEFRTKRDV